MAPAAAPENDPEFRWDLAVLLHGMLPPPLRFHSIGSEGIGVTLGDQRRMTLRIRTRGYELETQLYGHPATINFVTLAGLRDYLREAAAPTAHAS